MAQDLALKIMTLTLFKPTMLVRTTMFVRTTINVSSQQGKSTIPFHNAATVGLQTTLKRTATNESLKNIMPSRPSDINPKIKGVVAREEVVEAVEVDIIHKEQIWLMLMAALPPTIQYLVVSHTAAKQQSTAVF